MTLLIEAENIVKYFPVYRGFVRKKTADVRAVDDVSFRVNRGETLGVVGESGCGKSTLGRVLLRLTEPTSGRFTYDGKDMFSLSPDKMREMRQRMQVVFQDPYASLTPKMSVLDLIAEPLRNFGIGGNIGEMVGELLESVGLKPSDMFRYPHEFSGGQRQRIAIARALALNPDMVIFDEPTSALDVSVQAQILNLIKRLQRDLELTYIFISHDVSVIRHVSTEIAVMYLGRFIEIAPKKDLFDNTIHPYTKALLSAVPIPDPRVKKELIALRGDVPSPIDPPPGCRFHTRCEYAESNCRTKEPEMTEVSKKHFVACPVRVKEIH